MHTYALTFVSKDRPGIIADATKVLYEKGFNLKDTNSTLLQGVFSMIFLVEHKDEYTVEDIKSSFAEVNLNPAVYEIMTNGHEEEEPEYYTISVYGSDKPGIVHKITQKLAEAGINVIDLQTKQTSNNVYYMVLEIAVYSGTEEWKEDLKKISKELATDISIDQFEIYEL